MSQAALDRVRAFGHEEILIVQDHASALTAVIAIHDTTFGPAVGGTRMRPYPSLDEAVQDALRLSRAMTYKAVMAQMSCGGGKGVILGDPAHDKTPALLGAYAALLERLGGRFQTGCDMGLEPADVAVMARTTRYVTHTPRTSPMDTADFAALGVFESIRAAASELGLGLPGLRVAVQGLGQVGCRLANLLASEGARLTVADLDAGRAARAAASLGAVAVEPEALYDVEVDVFSPNAQGGVVNDETLTRLRCGAIVGGANEQLEEPRHGDALYERGILYAPDYVANAGGLLSLLYESGQADLATVTARVREIGARMTSIFVRSRVEGAPTHRLADRIVEERLATAREREPKPSQPLSPAAPGSARRGRRSRPRS